MRQFLVIASHRQLNSYRLGHEWRATWVNEGGANWPQAMSCGFLVQHRLVEIVADDLLE